MRERVKDKRQRDGRLAIECESVVIKASEKVNQEGEDNKSS